MNNIKFIINGKELDPSINSLVFYDTKNSSIVTYVSLNNDWFHLALFFKHIAKLIRKEHFYTSKTLGVYNAITQTFNHIESIAITFNDNTTIEVVNHFGIIPIVYKNNQRQYEFGQYPYLAILLVDNYKQHNLLARVYKFISNTITKHR